MILSNEELVRAIQIYINHLMPNDDDYDMRKPVVTAVRSFGKQRDKLLITLSNKAYVLTGQNVAKELAIRLTEQARKRND
jgi:hypothetical protein